MLGSLQVPQLWQVRFAQLPDPLRKSSDARPQHCCMSAGRLSLGILHLAKILTHHNEGNDRVGGKSASRGERIGVHFQIRHGRVTVVQRLQRIPAHISSKVVPTLPSGFGDTIDARDASHEEPLFLSVHRDVLESVLAMLIPDELHIGIMT